MNRFAVCVGLVVYAGAMPGSVTGQDVTVAAVDRLPVNPKGTFLRKMNDPLGEVATVFDLQQDFWFPIRPGDLIELTGTGSFFFNSSQVGGPRGDGTLESMYGVFSSTDTLLTPGVLKINAETMEEIRDRVPDSIPVPGVPWLDTRLRYDGTSGQFVETLNDTDHDFFINFEGMTHIMLQVPDGARFLMVAAGDTKWGDNSLFPNDPTQPPLEYALEVTHHSLALLPGDIDLNAVVDRADLAAFAGHFGRAAGSSWTTGDFDNDNATTLADLTMLQANLGRTLSPPVGSLAAVPEPASACLATLAGLTVAGAAARRQAVIRAATRV